MSTQMLKVLFAVGGLVSLSESGAMDQAVSGIWSNPAQPGHGFEVTLVTPTSAVVSWYTYSPFATPIWIVGVLNEASPGVLTGSMDYYDGMRFGTFNSSTNRRFPWGTLAFAVPPGRCDIATVTYNGTLTYQSGETFGSGSVPLQKLANVSGLPPCGGAPVSVGIGLYSGYLSSASGSFDLFAVIEANGDSIAVAVNTAVYRGRTTITGTQFNAQLTATPAAGVSFPGGNTFSLSGSARANDFLDGTFSGSGDSGVVSLGGFSGANRSFTAAGLAGTYTDPTGVTGFVGSANSSGTISGTDRIGCRFSGSIPTSGSNPIRLTLTVSNCVASGTYSGFAILSDRIRFGDSRRVTLALTGPTLAIAATLQR